MVLDVTVFFLDNCIFEKKNCHFWLKAWYGHRLSVQYSVLCIVF